jgi:glycosyltransferase involved in cell wall biosynthesis
MKQLLLITYYFPPCGGAGVQRWVRILKYLPAKGWNITVLTTKNGDYPILDESLGKGLSPQIKVVRSKTPVFGNFYKNITKDKKGIPYGTLNSNKQDSFLKRILYWVRINLIIPDARFLWNKYAYKEAVNLLRTDKYDLILTTSPPHSTQLIGLKLQKKFKIKWVTDFRDPWADIFYLKLAKQNKLSYLLNKYLEKKVIKNADLNLIVSDSIKNELPAGNKVTFTNSYDPANFLNHQQVKSDKFRIKYIGKITEGQDISSIITALNNLPHLHDKLEFTFIGTYESNPFNTAFPVIIKNYLPHSEAIDEMINSDLLVLLINDYPQNKGMLTTKLFEYLGANVPILCIGPEDGDANKIIQECGAGKCVNYHNVNSLKILFKDFYEKWEKNIKSTKNKNKNYSIANQIDELDEILSELILKG